MTTTFQAFKCRVVILAGFIAKIAIESRSLLDIAYCMKCWIKADPGAMVVKLPDLPHVDPLD